MNDRRHTGPFTTYGEVPEGVMTPTPSPQPLSLGDLRTKAEQKLTEVENACGALRYAVRELRNQEELLLRTLVEKAQERALLSRDILAALLLGDPQLAPLAGKILDLYDLAAGQP